MNGKELDRKYRGDFPNECVAEKADTERLMNQTGSLDGTKNATEDFRRDENGLEQDGFAGHPSAEVAFAARRNK